MLHSAAHVWAPEHLPDPYRAAAPTLVVEDAPRFLTVTGPDCHTHDGTSGHDWNQAVWSAVWCTCDGCAPVWSPTTVEQFVAASNRISTMEGQLNVRRRNALGCEITLDNLPAPNKLRRSHLAHAITDPTYWAYECASPGDPFHRWLTAATTRIVDEHLTPTLRLHTRERAAYLDSRNISAPAMPTEATPGTAWLFHPDMHGPRGIYGSSGFVPPKPDDWNVYALDAPTWAALANITVAHRFSDATVGLIRTTDADLFPGALIIDVQPDDTVDLLASIWKLTHDAEDTRTARRTAEGLRASYV